MGAASAVKAALFEAVAELGFATYTVRPQASDGGDEAVYPHVQIGVVVMSDWESATWNGFDFTARIHTRWIGRDEEQGLAIQDEIYTRLHHGSLVITGHTLILLERQMTSVTQLEGSFTGICEYHALIKEDQ